MVLPYHGFLGNLQRWWKTENNCNYLLGFVIQTKNASSIDNTEAILENIASIANSSQLINTTHYILVSIGNRIFRWLKFSYECFTLYGGLLLFGIICLTWSIPASLLYFILPRKIGKRLGRLAIMAGFRFFLFCMKLSGIIHLDLSELDTLKQERNLIIAPNHPCLLDAILIVSRLPHITCIMKAEIWDNIFLGSGARLAGYIRNDSPNNMIRLATKAVKNGSQLLVFPEGTRTQGDILNPFRGGFVIISKNADATIQTVFIETNSAFFSKGWPLFKKPEFPLIYKIRLGERFKVNDNTKSFLSTLETYYRDSLTTVK